MVVLHFTFVACYVLGVLFGIASPSAIPMWEYLTQDEKIMYLYNMFQMQVQDYCETDSCKQELKNYAWNKLKNMPEDHLDRMDPFQRDSGDIIWQSIMEGHEMLTMKPKTSTSTKPENFDENYTKDASAILETTNIAPDIYMIEVNKPQFNIQSEGSSYAGSNAIQDSSTTEEGFPIIEAFGDYQRIPLTGPMVVQVHVDGTPVKNGADKSLPEDDDLKQYPLTKSVYQNL